MRECGVCMRATIDITNVTFERLGDNCRVPFCRECLSAVLSLMAERYKEAIAASNEVIAAVSRILGLPERN